MPPFLGGGEMIKEVGVEGTVFNDAPHMFEACIPTSPASSAWAWRWTTWGPSA